MPATYVGIFTDTLTLFAQLFVQTIINKNIEKNATKPYQLHCHTEYPLPPPKSMLLVLDNKDYIMSCPLVTIYVITATCNCHTNIDFRGGYRFFRKFIDSQYILLMIV